MNECPYCGQLHKALCPRIKAIEFDAAGMITKIEFLTPMDYPQIKLEEPEQEYPKLVPKR